MTKEYTHTNENGKTHFYISAGGSYTSIEKREALRETKQFIFTEYAKYNKKTGYEVSEGSSFYKARLLTPEEYVVLKKQEICGRIERVKADIDRAEREFNKLKEEKSEVIKKMNADLLNVKI